MKLKFNNLYKQIPNWIKNKYLISACLFFIWILYFDTNSILTQIKKQKEINKVKHDIEYYDNAIKKDKKIIKILSEDSLTTELEEYFRKELFLSKKNEEVFIIE